MADPRRVQLHVPLAFKHEPAHDPRIRGYLDRGYRLEELQRLSDRDALVTLVRDEPAAGAA